MKRFVLIGMILFGAGFDPQALHAQGIRSPLDALSECRADAECKSAGELQTGCHRECDPDTDRQCGSTLIVCPAFNVRSVGNFPNCSESIPCRKPTRVWCEHGRCRSERAP